MAQSRDMSGLVRDAQKWPGWRVEVTKKGWMIYPPDRTLSGVSIHKTQSDHRAYRNAVHLLKQRGAPID